MGANILLSPAHTQTIFAQSTPRTGYINLKYRDQWSKISNTTYSTAVATADLKVYSSSVDQWNVGLVLMNDKTADKQLNTDIVHISSAYTRKLSGHGQQSNVITLGAAIGLIRTNIEGSNLWFGRQYDLNLFAVDANIDNGEFMEFSPSSYMTIDLGARWMYIDNGNMLGLVGALHHINKPTIGADDEDNIGTRLTLQAMMSRSINSNLSHKAAITFVSQMPSYQLQPAYALQFQLDGQDDVKANIGLAIRVSNSIESVILDAIIPSIGFSSSKWKAMLSYDINTSALNYYTSRAGAFELNLGYYLGSDY